MKIRKSMEKLYKDGYRTNAELKDFDPTEYTDTLVGAGSACAVGTTLPSGSIHPGPETLEADCGGYLRNQPIVGFGQLYTTGAGGVKCYGNFLLCPNDSLELSREKRASFAKEGKEKGRCYEYSVETENGIKTSVTPQHNSAIYSIEYPGDKNGWLIMDTAHKLDTDECIKEGFVTVDPKAKSICGGGHCTGNWSKIDWNMYFYMEFDEDFEEIGIFKGNEIFEITEKTTAEIKDFARLGAYLKFKEGAKVKVKIAISFVSCEKAKEFLDDEIPSYDYEAVRENAKDKWRNTLGVIELKIQDETLLKKFYTAMYHMNIQPRNRVSDHGLWDDFHTVWDTWKTVFPMYSLLYPEKMSSLVESFIERADKNQKGGNGIVIADEFVSAKEFLAGQGGNDIDNAIADAYLKGITLNKYTWEDAYRVLIRSAEEMRSPEYIEKGFATGNAVTATGKPYSYRFKSGAATLGFAFNDKAVATVAKELGTEEEYKKYEKRSQNWLNVWNKTLESEGFKGFPQSPNEDGTFEEGFDAHKGYNTHFYEATAWDASYINYNDVPRLIEAMGGRETFTQRLKWACDHSVNYFNDDQGAEGYLNFTNEPSFQIPWLFCTDEIRRPDLAAEVIDRVIKRFSIPDDYPGDEDNGGMSSYYVFLMCGFFPFATTENYYLHGTRMEEITFRLGNGKEFIITGENTGKGNIYVQSATWQDKSLNECKLTHSQILEGGELHFVMGSEPSDWGKR